MEKLSPTAPDTWPLVSVIVPAFGGPDELELCLKALQAQTYPAAQLEIIVVDNGSAPPLKPVVARFETVIYEVELCVGSYAARNRGLARARGEIIAFTDADCLPQTDWIEKGVAQIHNNPGCGLIGGRIALQFRDSAAPGLWELCDQLWMGFQQQVYVEECQFAATANAFTSRAVFERVGLFEASLKSGGDVNWGQRVAAAGYRLAFAPDAVVSHPARATRAEIFQKMRRLQGGHLDQERKTRGFAPLLRSNLRRVALPWRLFTPRDEILRRMANCLDANGQKRVFSEALQRRLILARWAMCLVRELEMVRITLGGRSKRQ